MASDSNSEMGEEESAVQCSNGAETMLSNSALSPVVWQCLTMSLQKSCPRNGTLSPPIYTLSWGGKNHLLKINHKSQKKKKNQPRSPKCISQNFPKTMCSKFIPMKIKTIFGNLKLTVFSSMKFHLKSPICQNVQILLFLKIGMTSKLIAIFFFLFFSFKARDG